MGFIVTNLWRSARRVVQFYGGRGTAEQLIKEGKNAGVVYEARQVSLNRQVALKVPSGNPGLNSRAIVRCSE